MMASLKASAPSPYWPAAWSLNSFSVMKRMREHFPADTSTRYPVRYLRYWFIRHLLEAHARRIGRSLNVLEVGVDRGQMLTFMGALPGQRLPKLAARWDALDIACDAELLRARGYSDYIVFNVEGGMCPPLERPYDVIIFLHLLEHLHAPEDCLRAFLPFLSPDGILTGGSPTMPQLIASLYERRLARKAMPFGHVSVLSPERIEQFAAATDLRLSFLSGSFLLRRNDSWMENYSAWVRMNIAFGSLFPSLGSEVYFALTRRRGPTTPMV